MNFVELKVNCGPALGEILIAELSEIHFESFEEVEGGLIAACEEATWNEGEAKALLSRYAVDFSFNIVPQVNWNEEWEKNYDPVKIADKIFIGASFHPAPAEFPHQLLVNPKMSFGTGHHATTSQVLEAQLDIDHKGKSVLDVGCGTGVLSILAHQLGAVNILAIDIDEWCIENSSENFTLNQCENIELMKCDIKEVSKSCIYDIVLANINRNILLEQLHDYVIRLKAGGFLLMSGFYQTDVEVLVNQAKGEGLTLVEQRSKDKWAILVMKKGRS